MMIEPLPNTKFEARLARGHEIRKGHKLKAVQVSSDGILWHHVYLCCGETIPVTVSSWEDVTPDRDTRREQAIELAQQENKEQEES